jgi:hypothetical protein
MPFREIIVTHSENLTRFIPHSGNKMQICYVKACRQPVGQRTAILFPQQGRLFSSPQPPIQQIPRTDFLGIEPSGSVGHYSLPSITKLKNVW